MLKSEVDPDEIIEYVERFISKRIGQKWINGIQKNIGIDYYSS